MGVPGSGCNLYGRYESEQGSEEELLDRAFSLGKGFSEENRKNWLLSGLVRKSGMRNRIEIDFQVLIEINHLWKLVLERVLFGLPTKF